MSNLKTFYYLLTSQIVLLLLVSGYSVYMVDVHCPEYDQLKAEFDSVPYNETNPATALSNTWALLSMIFSGCSGIPWWVYIVIFIPSLIVMIVYLVPFVGG